MTTRRKPGRKRTSAAAAELFDKFVDDMSKGTSSFSVMGWCRDNDVARGWATDYARRDPERTQRLAHAREAWIDNMIDETIEITSRCAENKDAIAKTRMQVDAILRIVEKLDPRRYSARMALGQAQELDDLNTNPADLATKASAVYERVMRRIEAEKN